MKGPYHLVPYTLKKTFLKRFYGSVATIWKTQ